jgi:excisionase family DNA binding protein
MLTGQPGKLYDLKGASELLCVAVGTLRKWVAAGKIPYLRVGRRLLFREQSLILWAEDMEQGARPRVEPGSALICGNCRSFLVDAPSGMWKGGYAIKCFACDQVGLVEGSWIIHKLSFYPRQMAVSARDICDVDRDRPDSNRSTEE